MIVCVRQCESEWERERVCVWMGTCNAAPAVVGCIADHGNMQPISVFRGSSVCVVSWKSMEGKWSSTRGDPTTHSLQYWEPTSTTSFFCPCFPVVFSSPCCFLFLSWGVDPDSARSSLRSHLCSAATDAEALTLRRPRRPSSMSAPGSAFGFGAKGRASIGSRWAATHSDASSEKHTLSEVGE